MGGELLAAIVFEPHCAMVQRGDRGNIGIIIRIEVGDRNAGGQLIRLRYRFRLSKSACRSWDPDESRVDRGGGAFNYNCPTSFPRVNAIQPIYEGGSGDGWVQRYSIF